MSQPIDQCQSLALDIMEVWAQRAQQQRAAFDAIKAYLR